MCFSTTLPFYEGIALFNNFTLLNDAERLLFEPIQITLTEVSGIGSCVVEHRMILPLQLQNICNDTIVVNNTYKYLLAPNNTFLACSSGLTRHLVNEDFIKRKDYCVLVQLFPCLRIHDSDDLLGFLGKGHRIAPQEQKRACHCGDPHGPLRIGGYRDRHWHCFLSYFPAKCAELS